MYVQFQNLFCGCDVLLLSKASKALPKPNHTST